MPLRTPGEEAISSPQNPRLKELVRLVRDGNLRRERGEFLVEGERVVAAAFDRGHAVRELFWAPRLLGAGPGGEAPPLVARARAAGVPVTSLSKDCFRKLADVPTPQGVAALVAMRRPATADLLARPDAFLLVAGGVQNPGNLGALLRTAEAAGATGVVTLPGTADLYHAKVVRGAAGALLALPVLALGEAEFLEAAAAAGLRLIGGAVDGAVLYTEAEYRRPLALLVGGEGAGLAPALRARCAELVRIPQAGAGESLNAAVAAGLLLYEVARRGWGRPAAGADGTAGPAPRRGDGLKNR